MVADPDEPGSGGGSSTSVDFTRLGAITNATSGAAKPRNGSAASAVRNRWRRTLYVTPRDPLADTDYPEVPVSAYLPLTPVIRPSQLVYRVVS